MSSAEVSVIVPCYDVEDYVADCLPVPGHRGLRMASDGVEKNCQLALGWSVQSLWRSM